MALNRLCSCSTKPLGPGKKYHYSILYNYYEGPSSGRRGDHLLSWNFLMDLKGQLSGHGYNEVMYHDIAVAGSNIFDNLFNMVNESEKIVVLLTPEFLHNGWHKYSGQAAIKNLLDRDKNNSKFVPIAISINKENIPENFGLSVARIIFTGFENNEADEGVWDEVHKAVGHTELHYEQNGDLHKEPCNLTVPTEIRIPHDPVEDLDNFNSIEVDGPLCAGGDADGDGCRGARRGNGRTSDEAASEQSENSNYGSPPVEPGDDGYTSGDNKSDHSPMSNVTPSIHLKDTHTGPKIKDPEQAKRQEGDGASSELKIEGTSPFSKPRTDSSPQYWYHRAVSWSLEKMEYFF